MSIQIDFETASDRQILSDKYCQKFKKRRMLLLSF